MGTHPEWEECVLMQAETCMQIEVMLHSDRSAFSHRPRWYLHVVQGGTELACIPRPYKLYNQGQIWELCQKVHLESSFWNISSLYSKVLVFCKDSRSSFSFCIQASRQKSAHKTFRIHGKLSMFILKSLIISSCGCCWILLLYMTDINQNSLCKYLNT